MKRKRFLHFAIISVSLIFLNSCATTNLQSSWKNDKYQDILKKVIVIVLDANTDTKKLFEKEFVRQFKARGIKAIPSYILLTSPYNEILDSDIIIEKIKEFKVDIVLITEPSKINETGTITYYYKPTSRLCPICCYLVSSGYIFTIETKIYDVKRDKLIWAASTQSFFDGSIKNTVKEFVPIILRDLQDKKLLL